MAGCLESPLGKVLRKGREGCVHTIKYCCSNTCGSEGDIFERGEGGGDRRRLMGEEEGKEEREVGKHKRRSRRKLNV